MLRNCLLIFTVVAVTVFVGVPVHAGVGHYAVTSQTTTHNADWLAVVQAEFGSGAVVADWSDIVVDFGDNPGGLADLLGGNALDSAYVYRDGLQYASPSYSYFIQNHYGQVPSGWLVLDTIGENTVDLGRWNTNGLRVLAYLASVLLPGDLNEDGFVGIDDLNIVLSNWNLAVPPGDAMADPTGDGFVGIDDLNEVLGNWNAGTALTSQTNIPEPTTLTLLSLGTLTTLRRQRH